MDCSYSAVSVTPTSPPTYSSPGNKARSADEWARYLYQSDANGVTGQQNVTTYTIDAFYAQQDANQTALLMSMARVGGGKYYPASNQGQLQTDLQSIFVEIQGVNSTFASASLPISASNRAVRDNQVFIGVFRPDPDLKPRWFGNLKQYQLVLDTSTGVALADSTGTLAVNPSTGFITSCASSFWTTRLEHLLVDGSDQPAAAGRMHDELVQQMVGRPRRSDGGKRRRRGSHPQGQQSARDQHHADMGGQSHDEDAAIRRPGRVQRGLVGALVVAGRFHARQGHQRRERQRQRHGDASLAAR